MKSIDIILPVYYGNLNELEESIEKQVKAYKTLLKNYEWNIVISINGKNAEEIINLSKNLSKKYRNVTYIYTEMPGKGHGVINGWLKSKADIRVYMDLDLSVDLICLPSLIKKIEQGNDISIGSRYLKESKVKRSLKRTIISIFYHLFLLKIILGTRYKDAQCGFKAISKKSAYELLPLVKDRVWFFESELLYIAQKKGYKIAEIPVIWNESKFSSLNLLKVVPEFFIKMIKLRFRKI